MQILIGIGTVIIGYILGSIPFGLLIVKMKTGKDIRQVESGRTGGTNAVRAAGFFAGLLTAILDILKGASSVWLAQVLVPQLHIFQIFAPLAAILGHNYSLFLMSRDQGGRLRYLNETTWFPIALLGNNMQWQAVDNRSADVTFTDCGQSVTARLIFDDSGRPINFIAQRYRENKGAYTLDTWTTPFTAWGLIGGLNLPLSGQAVWKFPDGDLPYIDVTLTEIEFNRPIDNF